jgi:hypothetical protein
MLVHLSLLPTEFTDRGIKIMEASSFTSPDFNVLYRTDSPVSPRMAYRLWRLADDLFRVNTTDLLGEMPMLVSYTVADPEKLVVLLRQRAYTLFENVGMGHSGKLVAQCVADDVILYVLFQKMEELLITAEGDALIEGDDNFIQHHESQIDDLVHTFKYLFFDPDIGNLWEIGNDEVLDPDWFEENELLHWEPRNWFFPYRR